MCKSIKVVVEKLVFNLVSNKAQVQSLTKVLKFTSAILDH